MSISDGDPVDTELAELSKLGLKLAFRERGVYILEYLESRQKRRSARRLAELGDSAAAAGLESEGLVEAMLVDESKAEFLDEVLGVAASSRYEPKIRYLGRCLAAAINATDSTTVDLTWLKVSAIRDLDAIHVELLHRVSQAQNIAAESVPRSQLRPSSRPVELPSVTEQSVRRRTEGADLPLGAFHAVMAVLVRAGLIVAEEEVDIEVDVEIYEDENSDGTKDARAETNPSVSTFTTYRVSGLGLELLDELLASSTSGDGSPVSSPAE